MRIQIIEPPFNRLYHDNNSLLRYPLSLGFLSSAVRKWTDWTVQAYNADFNIDYGQHYNVTNRYLMTEGFQRYQRCLKDIYLPIWNEVRESIRAFNPSVVGISAKSQNFRSAIIVARIAKEINPNITVIIGGPHPTMVGEQALYDPEVDVAVIGEGELTLVDILHALESSGNLESIPGLIFRRGDNIVRTTPRPYIKDLDQLPLPIEYAEEVLKDFEKYPAFTLGKIFAIRGCPNQCAFCGSAKIWSRNVRFRSAQNVVDEIRLLMDRGVTHVHFEDDSFGVKQRYIQELCQLIEEKCPGLTWSCEIPVQLVNDSNLVFMKRAGCTQISVGVESGSNEMLKKIKKRITIEQAIAALKKIRAQGILTTAFMMFGFPEETEETMQESFKAIRQLEAVAICFSVFTPYPGSELFQQCKEMGLIDDSFDISRYNHQSPENHFTAYISKERFQELLKKAMLIINKQEQKMKLKNRLRRMATILRNEGVMAMIQWALLGVARRFSVRRG